MSSEGAVISILDLMPSEERERAEKRFERRMSRAEKEDVHRVSNEVYIVAEFGYYFGWPAVQAIRNNEIELKEVAVLLEGARKVWYSKLVEQARANQVSVGSVISKKPGEVFNKGMKPFVKRSEI